MIVVLFNKFNALITVMVMVFVIQLLEFATAMQDFMAIIAAISN